MGDTRSPWEVVQGFLLITVAFWSRRPMGVSCHMLDKTKPHMA